MTEQECVAHACNSHDDLVASLNDVLRMLKAAHMSLGMSTDKNMRILNAAAVLEKAKAL